MTVRGIREVERKSWVGGDGRGDGGEGGKERGPGEERVRGNKGGEGWKGKQKPHERCWATAEVENEAARSLLVQR